MEVIDGGEAMDPTILSNYDKHMLRIKCQVLCVSLHLALEKMNGWTWNQCCAAAIKASKRLGISTVQNPKTVEKWYRSFREKRSFTIPLKYKHNLPLFLELNPDVCRAIKEYANSNLANLSVEMVSEYLHTVILPKMVEQQENSNPLEPGESKEDKEKAILKKFGLTNLCLSTVYRWIKKLGYTYEPRKKCYYVDGHEKEATVNYRWRFIERYLGYEKRMFRWIQITKQEASDLKDEGIIAKKGGYHYNHPETGVDMVEYHVDTCNLFQERMNKETQFGGQRSVRYPEGRMLIIWGHDEAIFKQYTLTKKSWRGPNGETAIVPKDEGAGIMISAFQCREFGFGMELSSQQLEIVNEYRRGKKYKDEEAAKTKRGSSLKLPLTKSPFVLEFE